AGNNRPNAEEVAASAKVGIRSVFRHFKDMESLYAEMSHRLETEFMAAARLPFTSPDWRGKLVELIDRRFDVFERIAPYRRAADGYLLRSPSLQTDIDKLSVFLRMRLQTVVPATAASGDRLDALDMLLSFESWNRMRHTQRLSAEATRRITDMLLAQLLA
ncbi:MAG: TetR/AcrR family transcriptional regulator, partial [Polymorphobacter sp.]